MLLIMNGSQPVGATLVNVYHVSHSNSCLKRFMYVVSTFFIVETSFCHGIEMLLSLLF